MNSQEAETLINAAFEDRAAVEKKDLAPAVEWALAALDNGSLRVAQKNNKTEWVVNAWLKKAILLSFGLCENRRMEGGWDKVPSKFENWSDEDFRNANFRAVPRSYVRRGAYIGQNVVLMPSFVNIGAYVDDGVMVDTWATVGSAAQIGKNVHLSGGAGIGGVLEPVQAAPVIIEDDCFIGARSEVAEGVIVRQGSVLAMGVFLTASTKIIDRQSGEIFQGEVPPYSVVVPGSINSSVSGSNPSPNLYCAVIVKRVDERTRAKTSINELLRQSDVGI